MNRPVALLGLSLLVTACQTYDFQRVTPLAVAQTTDKKIIASRGLKPNMMLLVDNSGSMMAPINAGAAGCPVGCGSSSNPCPGSCPTRVSEMKNAMGAFLQASGDIARLGVTVYPTDAQCGPSGTIDVALPAPTPNDDGTTAALTANAQQVNLRLQGLSPIGGTPTGASLSFLGDYAGLNDTEDKRDDFVLLLTDGLPNCNDTNKSQACTCDPAICGSCAGGVCAAQLTACKCTTSTCSGTYCAKGCLDRDGSIDVVTRLRTKGIRTIVVGFGADTAIGDGPDVLNGMAEAGGFARTCPNGTDAECGTGNRCLSTKVCEKKFYQAANGAELTAALNNISGAIAGNPCEFRLSSVPSDERFLAVIVDGQNVARGATTWDYAAGTVTFLGDLCNRVVKSTTANPVDVEFRIVEQL